MRNLLVGAAVAALVAATPALGINTAVSRGGLTQMITYENSANLIRGETGGSYSGVGTLVVTYASTATTQLVGICTGALVSSQAVLTAGHCLTPETTGDSVTSVSFYLPSYGESTRKSTYSVTNFEVDPAYGGNSLGGADLAMLTLGKAAKGHDVYSVYQGDPFTEFTRVGTGTIGTAAGTDDGLTDLLQREGNNLYEYTAADIFGADYASSNVLMSDFDDGTAKHDVFGRAGGTKQRGVKGESDSSPGDSGGPEFIDGQIAGVTSFGITGAIFDGKCGSLKDFDPYTSDGAPGAADLSNCTNSSVGELAGDTWVAPNLSFIQNYISGVPEPSSWAMMVAGFGLAGAAVRRERRRPVRAA